MPLCEWAARESVATRHLASVSAATATTATGWRGKRTADVVVSIVICLLVLPVLVLIGVLIKLTSRGPALFRHRRVGRFGREFDMLKFRTMHVDAEERLRGDAALLGTYLAWDHKIPGSMDPRITRVGRVLRATSLDELPQLLNIIAGSMSLVGPRPVERAQLSQYGTRVRAYLALRPGLTGLWQVTGRDSVGFPDRAEIDHDYVSACRWSLDAAILARTPLAVVRGLSPWRGERSAPDPASGLVQRPHGQSEGLRPRDHMLRSVNAAGELEVDDGRRA